MSDEAPLTLELDGQTVTVRRYRFGFAHALTLSAAMAAVVLAAAAATSLIYRAETDAFVRDTARAVAAVNRDRIEPPIHEDFRPPSPDAAPEAWARAKTRAGELWSAIETAIREAPRLQHERGLHEAFAALDQGDPRQVREFLAVYGNNPYAEELGYIGAVRRAVAERRLYRSGDIVPCDGCWCFRERPVPANDKTPTQ